MWGFGEDFNRWIWKEWKTELGKKPNFFRGSLCLIASQASAVEKEGGEVLEPGTRWFPPRFALFKTWLQSGWTAPLSYKEWDTEAEILSLIPMSNSQSSWRSRYCHQYKPCQIPNGFVVQPMEQEGVMCMGRSLGTHNYLRPSLICPINWRFMWRSPMSFLSKRRFSGRRHK